MSFETYNIVKNSTGAIEHQVGADATLDANAVIDNTPVGYTAYLGSSTDTPAEFYYIGATKTARPAFSTVGSWNTTSITANGTSTATFSASLPNPTTIIVLVPYIKGIAQPGPITETSGSFSLTTTVAGTYTVIFDAFPYKQLTTTITAT